MLERDELKGELSLVPPELPPEPFAIESENGENGERKITLKKALQQVIDFEEERSRDLGSRSEKTVKRRRHGSGHPRPRREKKDGTLPARSYLIIDGILNSTSKEPFRIEPSLPLFATVKDPPKIEIDPPFYTLICNQPAAVAVRLLKNSDNLQILWEYFYTRRTLWRGLRDRKIKWKEATDIMFFGKKFNFPSELKPFLSDITGKFELHRNTQGPYPQF